MSPRPPPHTRPRSANCCTRNDMCVSVLRMTQKNNWDAWKHYIYTSSHILACAENHLQATFRIGLSDFDVLVSLYEAPQYTLSMSSLKQTVIVTTSGLSRAVTRMTNRGWVVKTSSTTDRRQVTLTLSEEGVEAFRTIAREHRAIVRRLFFDALSPKDQEILGKTLSHLRDHVTA